MDKTQLVIIGAGEIAKVAYEYFTYDSKYDVVAFSVHREYCDKDEFLNLPLVPIEEIGEKYPVDQFVVFVAMGNGKLNRERAKVYYELKEMGYDFVSYVSSQAFVWRNVEIGENCFILEYNNLEPFVKIGDNVTLWSGNHIGHSSIVKNHCFITSHCVISGFCEIGEYNFLGVNCCVANHIKIANDNFIALGTVINQNTKENAIYRGNPAELAKISAKKFCKVKE